MNKKILVIGNGFVGLPLAAHLGADISTKRLENIKTEDVEDYDVVINTAAKTSIDWCEEHKVEAFKVNVVAAAGLASVIKKTNDMYGKSIKYVFFSSACIFKSSDTSEINTEYSTPDPQCFYTYTKLMAEQLIMEIDPTTLIIRPRLLISEKSHPRNTIDKLLKYPKVINCQESATILEDLIPKVEQLIDTMHGIEREYVGPYNIFNEGTISPSEIMEIFDAPHTRITKQELDKLTEGKAKRVSTLLGTTRTSPLPEIRNRIKEIRSSWFIDKG